MTKREVLEGRVEALKALAHERRLAAFLLLARARREMAVGELQRALVVPATTMSHHLDQLRRGGLVTSRRQERFIYYSVATEMLADLVQLLTTCR